MAIQQEALGTISPAIEQLTPKLDTEVFSGHEKARFYVGVLATPKVIAMPDEWLAARQLRAKVYIDEMHFLSPEDRQPDGGEMDIDDWRSVQFGVIENQLNATRLVGTSRLILKDTEDDTLPIEAMFPEAFTEGPAPVDSAEVSRFIARHERKVIQRAISLGLIRSMTAWLVNHSLEPVYAVVEEPLARTLDGIRLPYDVIAAPKFVLEYKTENKAIAIHPRKILDSVRPNGGSSPIAENFFKNTLENNGLGYFGNTMLEVEEDERTES